MKTALPPAVITGLSDPMVLAVARSLGRRGIGLVGVDANLSEISGRSRYFKKRVRCRDMFDSSLIETLAEVGRALDGRAVLINTTDQSALTVSEHRERLAPWYNFVLPGHDDLVRLMNKRLLYPFAAGQGIPVPETHFTETPQELWTLADSIEFPCIVKPENRDNSWMLTSPDKVLLARSREELQEYVERYGIGERKLVVQRWVPGPDGDIFFCLCYIDGEGHPRAIYTGRKLLQYPAGSGSTSVAETAESGAVREMALSLLSAGRCVGLCSVEFKLDSRDGTWWLVEPTAGRPDTQVGIAVAAGLDLPYLAYLDASGALGDRGDLPAARTVRWINEPRYIGNIKDSFTGGGKGGDILGLLKGGNLHFAFASLRDPLPPLVLAIRIAGSAAGKAVAGLARFLKRGDRTQRRAAR